MFPASVAFRLQAVMRIGAAVLGCQALVACGGSGGASPGPEPRFVAATHGRADFDESGPSCPGYLDFSIFLQQDGRGWVSLEHEEIGSNLVEVSWEETGGRIEIDAPAVGVEGLFVDDPYYRAEVGWRELSLRVQDDDGDGVAELGDASVTLTCEEYDFHGDDYEQDVELELDPAVESATLFLEPSEGTEPLHPWSDTFTARATRPVLIETVATAALTADGIQLPATAMPLNPQGPLADGVRFDPTGPVPFDASIGVDAGGLTDAMETPVVAGTFTIETVTDPGPLTSNPGFEGSGGWLELTTAESSQAFPAAEGERYAYVYAHGSLVGYFDVPLDAATLRFEVAVYNELGCPNGPGFSVRSAATLPYTVERVGPIDCPGCDAWGEIIPWHTFTYDISAARGQRIVFEAFGASYTECAPDLYPELDLDDFRIE
jgi:hypothetical protein